ncbi:MAG: ATP-dependent helicase, partial [Desulfovibrio sp.]|nr:ATP-dependent helicase [Desulfovibrio sp.]
YQNALNAAQYDAVTSNNGAVLVVAGAGSGKTRTIVYRLAWLAEHGVDPSAILLLTFTRKAAKEMLSRANLLLGQNLSGIQGGTFHAFAFQTLKIWHPKWLKDRNFSLMDSSDALDAIKHCKSKLNIGQNDRSFPKSQTILGLLSKSRNKELPLSEILSRDAYQLLPYSSDLEQLDLAYHSYRREQGLLDYDDLLFELEDLLLNDPRASEALHRRFQYLLVDEYQDTNLVQARLVRLLADAEHNPGKCQVMAVGDEAQAIYAFRGANVRNILDFPKHFSDTQIIRLEENYRSTQPVLNIANTILAHADESFQKILFTRKESGFPVFLHKPLDENFQAELVAKEITNLLNKYPPEEIAVLFRSGFHSYFVEAHLNRMGIPFRKYGGMKYTEAAHIKDCLAFARLLLNPLDLPAFTRLASMHTGVGPKTIEKLFLLLKENNQQALRKSLKRYPNLALDLDFIERKREEKLQCSLLINDIVEYFEPRLKMRYMDDWPSRRQGLEEIVHMASNYNGIEDFLADLVLENQDSKDDNVGKLVLSTIHSAKGLEWNAVLLLGLVEDRFPSHHARAHSEDFEEERRLMYVACTRARQELHLYVPQSIYNRAANCNLSAVPSPFVCEIEDGASDNICECGNNISKETDEITVHARKKSERSQQSRAKTRLTTGMRCHHAIFGEGKVLRIMDATSVKVHFIHYGEKIIRIEYLNFGS